MRDEQNEADPGEVMYDSGRPIRSQDDDHGCMDENEANEKSERVGSGAVLSDQTIRSALV